MDFRAASYITDFPFYQERRIDAFERFDGLLGLAHVLLKGQRRTVKDDHVKARLHRLDCFSKRMGVVGIEKDGKVEFLA